MDVKPSSPPSAAVVATKAKLSYRQQWFAFFVVGIFNNFAYILINSCAKSFTEQFDARNYIGLILWANIGVGTLFKGLNMYCFASLTYHHRMILTCILFISGHIALTFALYVGFWFAIVAIVLVGSASSLGESVILGYLKDFDANLTGAWSSGNGVAAVGGTLTYLLLHGVIGLTNQQVFLFCTPTIILYYLAFRWVYMDSLGVTATPSAGNQTITVTSANDATHSTSPLSPVVADTETPLLVNRPRVSSGANRAPSVWSLVSVRCILLALVYFFEYVASVGFAAKSNLHPDANNWWMVNAYEVLAFCYQFGVLLSRSSISIVKIKRVDFMTLLQAINFGIWQVQALVPFLPLWAQFLIMVYTGLLGGAMYVNTFYLLISDAKLTGKDRELGINYASIFVNVGIVAASVFQLIADATYLKDRVD